MTERALAEMARVTSAGGGFAASGFAAAGEEPGGLRGWLWRRLALHFVPLGPLARAAGAAGFPAVETRMAGPAVAYVWGRRPAAQEPRMPHATSRPHLRVRHVGRLLVIGSDARISMT